MPGPRCGLVNRQAVKRSQSILLTESIIDALTLYAQGFKNVVPIYGVNGLTDEHLALFDRKVKEAYGDKIALWGGVPAFIEKMASV